MTNELCRQFGFDRAAIEERLNLLGLGGPAIPMIAEELQSHVIQPNVEGIVEDMYDAIGQLQEFQAMVQGEGQINHLKMTQRKYLLSMGQDFASPDYFESRLRVGAAHDRAAGLGRDLRHGGPDGALGPGELGHPDRGRP